MLTEEELQKLEEESDIRIAGIYREYCSQMRAQNLMDYDDQMLYAYKMLRIDPGLLAYFQKLYPYICVDEAQDTSKIQHAIIALLATESGNLFMVGDEDQSIYGFRAAYPEALLSFEKNHKGAKVLLMEENFRSRNFFKIQKGRVCISDEDSTGMYDPGKQPAKERYGCTESGDGGSIPR